MLSLRDAIGTVHACAPADARIASLVPSITELVCDLGLAAQLVARSGFCIHPREVVAAIPVVIAIPLMLRSPPVMAAAANGDSAVGGETSDSTA